MNVYTQMKYREKYNLQKRRIFLFLSGYQSFLLKEKLLSLFDSAMTSASSNSSSISSPLGSGQTTTMALTSSYQQLNHALPVKLD